MKLATSIVSLGLLLFVSTSAERRTIASRRPTKNDDADESHAALRPYHRLMLRKADQKSRDADAMAPPSMAPPSRGGGGNRHHRFLASPGFVARPTRAFAANRVRGRDADETVGVRPRHRLGKIDVPRRRLRDDRDDDANEDDAASADRAARPSVDTASALAIALAAAHRVHNMAPER